MKYEIERSRFTILFQSVYKIAKENENMGPEIRVFENSQLPHCAHTLIRDTRACTRQAYILNTYEYTNMCHDSSVMCEMYDVPCTTI